MACPLVVSCEKTPAEIEQALKMNKDLQLSYRVQEEKPVINTDNICSQIYVGLLTTHKLKSNNKKILKIYNKWASRALTHQCSESSSQASITKQNLMNDHPDWAQAIIKIREKEKLEIQAEKDAKVADQKRRLNLANKPPFKNCLYHDDIGRTKIENLTFECDSEYASSITLKEISYKLSSEYKLFNPDNRDTFKKTGYVNVNGIGPHWREGSFIDHATGDGGLIRREFKECSEVSKDTYDCVDQYKSQFRVKVTNFRPRKYR